MSFRRFLLVIAALSSANCVQADSTTTAKTLSPNLRLQRGLAEPKATIATAFPRGGADKKVAVAQTAAPTKKAAVVMGLLLALNSGFINGCCLSGAATADGSKQAVAAVTASWTNSALGMASGNMAQFGFLGKIIVAFISGSAIAGFLNPKPTPFLVEPSSYRGSFGIGAFLLVLAAIQLEEVKTVKSGLLLCAMANGIQNSVTSTMTQNLCRTSHFTGISSDMGTFAGQVLRGNPENLFKLKVFAGLAACFWMGGYLSYQVSKDYGSSSLFFSAGLYLFVGAVYDKVAKNLLK
jgi:hypothetical protein